ncbi:MAG: prepilin peptidase [Minisyncoccia bacterium]
MTFAISFVFFAFGAIIASFIGVLVARLHTGQSFFVGRSRCDVCDIPLNSFSLAPIISFVVSRGRAQCCDARISLLAPASEVTLGVLFSLAYLTIGFSASLPLMLFSLSTLLALVLYDLAHQILPSSLLWIFVFVSAVTGFFGAPSLTYFSETLFIAFCIALSLAAIHFFSRGRAMGFADAPLALGLSLLVGPVALTGFVFSFWIGSVIGIVLLLQRPRGSRMGVEVPFAPFLAAGFLLAYFTQWNLFTYFLLVAVSPSH